MPISCPIVMLSDGSNETTIFSNQILPRVSGREMAYGRSPFSDRIAFGMLFVWFVVQWLLVKASLQMASDWGVYLSTLCVARPRCHQYRYCGQSWNMLASLTSTFCICCAWQSSKQSCFDSWACWLLRCVHKLQWWLWTPHTAGNLCNEIPMNLN